MRISGYFSNKHYLKELQCSGKFKSLELSEPSIWFEDLQAQAIAEMPVMLHIRRGDFVANQSAYGLLSEQYYRDAISCLPEGLSKRPIWVFCDQTELIENWGLWKNRNVIFIREDDSPKRDPAEFMKLMSLGSAIVIANSTFSYFSAALSQTAKHVYCPYPIMKGMETTPEQVYFDFWTCVPSSWE